MRVSELIDILSDYPPDAEVQLAMVQPVDDDEDDVTVERYPIEGILPWQDDDEDSDDDEQPFIWLIGGEPEDVEEFLTAIEQ